MRWQGRRQSTNIEDRRGQQAGIPGGFGGGMGPRMRLPGGMRAGGGLGGGGLIVVIIIVVIAMFAGINPVDLLTGGGSSSLGPGSRQSGEMGTPTDEAGQFVAAVLADTEDAWTGIFAAEGARYEPPTLVLFSGSTSSACGYANAAVGPFYCAPDRKVYIDLAFYDELRTRFDAPGDFAEAYVIAHEIGHHIQNVLGTLPEVSRARERAGEAESNRLSVRLELQADCYAGMWAHSAEGRGILEVGDIDEALNAAAQIGDDALQMRTQGYVVPESFNHGSSEQRSRWFRRGYTEGELAACDTFSVQDV
jgi:predicted metalloprotease